MKSEVINKGVPGVSIVLLSHNRPTYLKRALDSISSQTYSNLEVVVVDNRSETSAQITALVKEYPGFKLISNRRNLGFTGGMNRGIEAASGEFVHCTVDDVVLGKDCIGRLVEYALKSPNLGLLSGILYNEDGRTIRCAGGEFILGAIYRQNIFRRGETDGAASSEPYEVKYVPGGMIFAGTGFLRSMGGFRKDFFIYAEDTDLCARVTKAGRSIKVVPQAKAVVLDAPHAFTDDGIAYHKIKNLFAIYLLHARLRVLPEFFLRYGLINVFRTAYSNPRRIGPTLRAWKWTLLNARSLLSER
jgi:GT2 family glycosyltransferase